MFYLKTSIANVTQRRWQTDKLLVWKTGGKIMTGKAEVLQEKATAPPKISHGLSWERTRASKTTNNLRGQPMSSLLQKDILNEGTVRIFT